MYVKLGIPEGWSLGCIPSKAGRHCSPHHVIVLPLACQDMHSGLAFYLNLLPFLPNMSPVHSLNISHQISSACYRVSNNQNSRSTLSIAQNGDRHDDLSNTYHDGGGSRNSLKQRLSAILKFVEATCFNRPHQIKDGILIQGERTTSQLALLVNTDVSAHF